jgi:hypothetical protein
LPGATEVLLEKIVRPLATTVLLIVIPQGFGTPTQAETSVLSSCSARYQPRARRSWESA